MSSMRLLYLKRPFLLLGLIIQDLTTSFASVNESFSRLRIGSRSLFTMLAAHREVVTTGLLFEIEILELASHAVNLLLEVVGDVADLHDEIFASLTEHVGATLKAAKTHSEGLDVIDVHRRSP